MAGLSLNEKKSRVVSKRGRVAAVEIIVDNRIFCVLIMGSARIVNAAQGRATVNEEEAMNAIRVTELNLMMIVVY
jgi:hypothetical protein